MKSSTTGRPASCALPVSSPTPPSADRVGRDPRVCSPSIALASGASRYARPGRHPPLHRRPSLSCVAVARDPAASDLGETLQGGDQVDDTIEVHTASVKPKHHRSGRTEAERNVVPHDAARRIRHHLPASTPLDLRATGPTTPPGLPRRILLRRPFLCGTVTIARLVTASGWEER